MYWRSFNNMEFSWKIHNMMFKEKGGVGGSKAFWTMFKETALFLQDGFPYVLHLQVPPLCESLCRAGCQQPGIKYLHMCAKLLSNTWELRYRSRKLTSLQMRHFILKISTAWMDIFTLWASTKNTLCKKLPFKTAASRRLCGAYEKVSDQGPVWVRSEDKIPSAYISIHDINIWLPEYSSVP